MDAVQTECGLSCRMAGHWSRRHDAATALARRNRTPDVDAAFDGSDFPLAGFSLPEAADVDEVIQMAAWAA